MRPASSVPGPEGLSWPTVWPAWGPVVLRPWGEEDLPAVAELATDPYLPLIGTVPARYTAAEGRAYIARQGQRLVEGTGWSYAVVEAATGRAVGGAGLWLHRDRPATAGYSIVPSRRGEGLATAALQALTGFAWSVGLERVELLVEPENAASRRVAERAGYDVAEWLPEHQELGGVQRDVCRYVAVRPPTGAAALPPERTR